MEKQVRQLLFDTNLSVNEIADELQQPVDDVWQLIDKNNWDWIRRTGASLSKGHSCLMRLLQELFPRVGIQTEYPVGNSLFVDIYISVYHLGLEYHGRQHFEFVEHYHKNLDGFKHSQERDEQKKELCRQRGITLVVFTYQDELTNNLVYERIMKALEDQDGEAVSGDTDQRMLTWRELAAVKRRERNREAYRRAKELRDGRNRND